ncbi:MAG: ABC transporter ATP-binding protein [Methanosarcinales archaeon]
MNKNGSNSTIVDLIKVEKIYQLGKVSVPVLNGIDLQIKQGEFLAIMGPSGSGKSTLMNLIGCLDRPSGGNIIINGRDINVLSDSELARFRGKEIGFVFQTFNLINRMSALKNVELPMVYQKVSGSKRQARAKELLKMVGLGDRIKHKPNELSGGQNQRIAIARALVNDPPMLLADEPTGNLDTKSSTEIMQIFTELHSQGRTIIMVTHDPEIAEYADRIVKVRDGRIENT